MAVALRRTLPPTNSLVVFEAAARYTNFTRAAEELSVTQSAVSRQVQLLEDFLGTTLFQRHARGLQLTREGERLHRCRWGSSTSPTSRPTSAAIAGRPS